jgi:hypothetical protein
LASEAARWGADHAVDPVIRRVLARIGCEESGHRELARRIVEWTLHVEPSLLPELREALERSRSRVRYSRTAADVLLPHGRVGPFRTFVLAQEAHDWAAAVLTLAAHRAKLLACEPPGDRP